MDVTEDHRVAVSGIGIPKLVIIWEWYCLKAIYNLEEQAKKIGKHPVINKLV